MDDYISHILLNSDPSPSTSTAGSENRVDSDDNASAASDGAPWQLVLLGCGLDCRAYRLACFADSRVSMSLSLSFFLSLSLSLCVCVCVRISLITVIILIILITVITVITMITVITLT